MSDNLRTLGGGGGGSRRFPFSSPSSGLPQPKNDPLWLEPCSFLLRICLFVRRRINRSAQF